MAMDTTTALHSSDDVVDDFFIDALLDLPSDDHTTDAPTPHLPIPSSEPHQDSSSSSTSSSLPLSAPLATDFPLPVEDLVQLEWLSNFVEESFSGTTTNDLQQYTTPHYYPFHPTPTHQPSSVPAKARSKRSRPPPHNWTSRLLVVSPPPSSSTTSSSDSSDIILLPKKPPTKRTKKEGGSGGSDGGGSGEGRRCLHCATDKTPQWRTGPMGPKTLCNACGVRYKSGRLVPEYRPAASPTFVLAKHSNSHRKVMELRRQKEVVRTQHHQPFSSHHHHHHPHHHQIIFDGTTSNGDDYLIHHHDFRQLL